MRADPSTSLYTSLSVFLLGAIALVVPSGYSIGAVLLLLGGIYSCFTRVSLSWQRQDYAVLGVLMAFGAVWIVSVLIHGGDSSHYDKPIRFILACLGFVLIVKYPPRLTWLWLGLGIGAIAACIWSGYQKFFLDIQRAGGYTNAIQYGNLAMLMGVWCVAGLGWAHTQTHCRRWQLLLVVGALCGVLASLLSGSRGGWIGLPVVLWVLYRAYGRMLAPRIKLALAALILASGAIVLATPQLHVAERLHLAVSDVDQYFNHQNAHTSVGARFAMWHGATQLYLAKPVFGWGERGYQPAMAQLVDEGKADPIIREFGHPHNEILNVASKHGTIGLIALLLLWGVPLKLFAAGLRSADLTVRALATAGILLPVTYIDYGLSQAFLSHNSGVMMYAFWLVVWWGCYRRYAQSAATANPVTT